ncbi:MAG: NusA-like transcription termination signal-binding factor [ANME-2 cluster archaeon]|nr:NusA-like transcription termination signal-binding factor [ANME-2 cluster archaeon]
MSEVRINTNGIRYIALFENLTGATAKDCLVDDENNRVIFVVKSGDMGIAIGKNGEHINRVVKNIGRHVEVVEYSDDPEKFIKSLLQPANANSVKIGYKGDKRIAYVEVSTKDKGLAIGRNGRNIEKVKVLSKRHHDIDDVTIQ